MASVQALLADFGNLQCDDVALRLLAAVRGGNAFETATCLSEGANANSVARIAEVNHPVSPLCVATSLGHRDICDILIKHGADPDMSCAGYTPLYLAAQGGHADVAMLLICARASVDIATPSGVTPLMVACHQGRPECVKMLLQAGGDHRLATREKLTAADVAAANGHQECLALCQTYEAWFSGNGTWGM